MATPTEKLADALFELKVLQDQGIIAVRSQYIKRMYREILVRNGFLIEVMKGWYIPSRPDEQVGESTSWYASFWGFCSAYLNERFSDNWCLSPEQSIRLHCGNWQVPQQLLVRTPKGSNKPTALPHNTSLFDLRLDIPNKTDMQIINGMRVFGLAEALIGCSSTQFIDNPSEMRTALTLIQDASQILRQLLDRGHSTIAGRLVGAFQNIGKNTIATTIQETMRSAGYSIHVVDPFEKELNDKFKATFSKRQSPYVTRLQISWMEMREIVIKHFPKAPGLPKDPKAYLKNVDDIYLQDAYHSLSIEGYQVNEELIHAVRSGKWNPETFEQHQNQKNALAARGYWQSFTAVKDDIKKILKGNLAGRVVEENHDRWYRELFAPSVEAGILKASDLAGYRNQPVFIRRSMHVPPNQQAVYDLMPAFFELLTNENEAGVRAVLGHFMFVYIHPYIDGNGRIGRFLMNTMLASGGYPWTVIPMIQREQYMSALEEASVRQNIIPFAKFVANLVKQQQF